MSRRGFLRPTGSAWQVGAEDAATGYTGPVAEVRTDGTWLFVETDPYEGCAMLNIEALPQLIRALRHIQTDVRSRS